MPEGWKKLDKCAPALGGDTCFADEKALYEGLVLLKEMAEALQEARTNASLIPVKISAEHGPEYLPSKVDLVLDKWNSWK